MKQAKAYKSIDFLPMWNYYKALETEDLRYLLKDIDYEELPECNDDLTGIWSDINLELYQYSISKNQRAKNNFNKQKKINELKYEYELIHKYIQYLANYDDDEIIDKLSTLGYKIDKDKNIVDELVRIKKKSQNLVSKINFAELQINNVQSSNDTDHYSELNAIRRHTGLPIDEKKVSIREYYNIRYDVINEIEKKQLKNG